MERGVGRAKKGFLPGHRRVLARSPAAKQAANVHLAMIQAAQPDISIPQDVHLEVCGKGYLSGMNFQAKPTPALFDRLGASAAGADKAFVATDFPHAIIFPQVPTAVTEVFRQPIVHRKPG